MLPPGTGPQTVLCVISLDTTWHELQHYQGALGAERGLCSLCSLISLAIPDTGRRDRPWIVSKTFSPSTVNHTKQVLKQSLSCLTQFPIFSRKKQTNKQENPNANKQKQNQNCMFCVHKKVRYLPENTQITS